MTGLLFGALSGHPMQLLSDCALIRAKKGVTSAR